MRRAVPIPNCIKLNLERGLPFFVFQWSFLRAYDPRSAFADKWGPFAAAPRLRDHVDRQSSHGSAQRRFTSACILGPDGDLVHSKTDGLGEGDGHGRFSQ